MIDLPPTLPTTRAYLARLDDVEYWWSHALRVFERHGIDVDKGDVEPKKRGSRSPGRLAARCATFPTSQAVGLAQHRTMDVFHKLPRLLPLEDIATLDELAAVVFGV